MTQGPEVGVKKISSRAQVERLAMNYNILLPGMKGNGARVGVREAPTYKGNGKGRKI